MEERRETGDGEEWVTKDPGIREPGAMTGNDQALRDVLHHGSAGT
jgi:hypothetical protein